MSKSERFRSASSVWFLWLLVVGWYLTAGVAVAEDAAAPAVWSARPVVVNLNCDPCVERPNTVVRVIVHGARDDIFWQQVAVAVRQIAASLRVSLQFDLYDRVDAERMAADIRALSSQSSNRPDVLLVTLPSTPVEEAVRDVVEATGLPVFGMNSGYNRATALGLLAFVGMDEFRAGVVASQHIKQVALQRQLRLRKVLFVNPDKSNFALDQRRRGLTTEFLPISNNNGTDSATSVVALPQPSVEVDELNLDGGQDPEAPDLLRAALRGCLYQAVVVGGSGTLDVTLEEIRQSGCSPTELIVGSFDTNTRIYQALAVSELDFAVSQQHWLQAATATLLASVYATTGMRLQFSSNTEFGTYLSGPQIFTVQNLPTDTARICETEGFPVCSLRQGDNLGVALDSSGLTPDGCLCFNRPGIRLAAVLHGVETDSFWWPVRDAARQAAIDLDVQLDLELFPPGDTPEVLFRIMAGKMISFCLEGVDGLIVTIPSPMVQDALQQCQELNVPIISLNAGGEISGDLGLLHHVAQDEYTAGFLAGQQLIQEGGITRGFCLNHVPGLEVLVERCRGFQDALQNEFGSTAYLGEVGVESDNDDLTISRTEQAVQERGNNEWGNLGLLTVGSTSVPALLTLLRNHPGAVGGTFDLDPEIVSAVGRGDLAFGIDQQPYLQGYMPVVLLTWFAQTGQSLVTHVLSGPKLILDVPSPAEKQCQQNGFQVCPPPIDIELNQLGALRIVGDFLGGTTSLTALCFALYVAWHRKTPKIQSSQPIFLLMVCGGAGLIGSTIFALSVDDGVASMVGADVGCMAAPWLFTIGFSITFAALYSKLRRLNKLIKNAVHFRRIRVRANDVMTPFFVLLGLNLMFLTTWTAADPMYWKRSKVSETESYGLCRLGDTGVSIAMALAIFFVNVLALLLALVEAYKSRKVSYEFSESGSIAIVVASILQVAIVGVPILPLVRDDPAASFLLKSGLVFIVSMSTLLCIFVPKLRSTSSGNSPRDVLRAMQSTVSMMHGVGSGSMGFNSTDDESRCFSGREFTSNARHLRQSLKSSLVQRIDMHDNSKLRGNGVVVEKETKADDVVFENEWKTQSKKQAAARNSGDGLDAVQPTHAISNGSMHDEQAVETMNGSTSDGRKQTILPQNRIGSDSEGGSSGSTSELPQILLKHAIQKLATIIRSNKIENQQVQELLEEHGIVRYHKHSRTTMQAENITRTPLDGVLYQTILDTADDSLRSSQPKLVTSDSLPENSASEEAVWSKESFATDSADTEDTAQQLLDDATGLLTQKLRSNSHSILSTPIVMAVEQEYL